MNWIKISLWLYAISVITIIIIASFVVATDLKTKEDKLKDKIVNDWKNKDNKTLDKDLDIKIKKIDEQKGTTIADIEVNGSTWKMITSS